MNFWKKLVVSTTVGIGLLSFIGCRGNVNKPLNQGETGTASTEYVCEGIKEELVDRVFRYCIENEAALDLLDNAERIVENSRSADGGRTITKLTEYERVQLIYNPADVDSDGNISYDEARIFFENIRDDALGRKKKLLNPESR